MPDTAQTPTPTHDASGVLASDGRRRVVAALHEVIEAVLEPLGYELVDLEWAAGVRRGRLRVYLDHPDGVGLDDCARMSRVIDNALDAAEAAGDGEPAVRAVLAGPYDLEVSSPGLDRPLTKRGHFQRFLGRRVTVRTEIALDGTDGRRTFHGRLEGVEPDPGRPEDPRAGAVTIRDEDGDVLYRIPLAAMRRANLVFEG